MNEEEKLIKEQFEKLPPSLQKAIESVPWKSSIREIAVTNKLPLEQVPIVERETMFIIYGFESPDDYIKNLMRETQINEDAAVAIANAVNEKIIKTIDLKYDEFDKPQVAPNTTPKVSPANLPMVEKGEVVHDVPHVAQPNTPPSTVTKPEMPPGKPVPPVSGARYPGGKDPYREPLV